MADFRWVTWLHNRVILPGHDAVIKWKHFSRYWPFVRGTHQSPVDSPNKGQWRGTLMFSLICACTNVSAGDLRRHCALYDVIVMDSACSPTMAIGRNVPLWDELGPPDIHSWVGGGSVASLGGRRGWYWTPWVGSPTPSRQDSHRAGAPRSPYASWRTPPWSGGRRWSHDLAGEHTNRPRIDPSHKSHNALDIYRTMHHFVANYCYKMMHCGIWYRWTVGFVQQVYTNSNSKLNIQM